MNHEGETKPHPVPETHQQPPVARWYSSLIGRRWLALVCALLVACVFAIFAIILYAWGCHEITDTRCGELRLVFPYFASCALFFAVCVWVVMQAHTVASRVLVIQETGWVGASAAYLTIGFVMALVLTFSGMAGPQGRQAALLLGCFVTHTLSACDTSARSLLTFGPADVFTAVSNAASITVLLYLARKCYELSKVAQGVGTDGGPGLGKCMSAFSELLMLGSALLVASTLSLFLFFAMAEELRLVTGREASRPTSSPQLVLTCEGRAMADCKWQTNDSPRSVSYRMAASMAFVAGLAFSGVLFFLFATTSASLDDAMRRAATQSQKSVRTVLEDEGIASEGPTGKVLSALALLAPALTGALAMLVTK